MDTAASKTEEEAEPDETSEKKQKSGKEQLADINFMIAGYSVFASVVLMFEAVIKYVLEFVVLSECDTYLWLTTTLVVVSSLVGNIVTIALIVKGGFHCTDKERIVSTIKVVMLTYQPYGILAVAQIILGVLHLVDQGGSDHCIGMGILGLVAGMVDILSFAKGTTVTYLLIDYTRSIKMEDSIDVANT